MYGMDDTPKIWCGPCAKKEYAAQKISEERRCDFQKKCKRCKKAVPGYGYDDTPRIWCSLCAKVEYEVQGIVEERRCDFHKKCAFVFGDGTRCPIFSTKHVMCARHDTTKKRIRKTKEMVVVDYLMHRHKDDMSYNKRESIECSAVSQQHYFPDITWDRGAYMKHLEIDEQQHKSYMCECKRIMSLAQSRYEVATLLIRYNPDAMHIDGTNWRWKQKDRLRLLERTLEWADSAEAQREACEAWSRGQVLVIYLFYDDKMCRDEDGEWPGQVCLLGVEDHSETSTAYHETQHHLPSICK